MRTWNLDKASRHEGSAMAFAELRVRRIIAADLHNGLAQNLTTAHMMLEDLESRTNNDLVARKLIDIRRQMHRAIKDVQGMLSSLGALDVADCPLTELIMRETKHLEHAHGLCFQIDISPYPFAVTHDTKISLLHVIRELLRNVVKHARAQTVRLQARVRGSAYEIIIDDDGVGFDQNECQRRSGEHGGFGLSVSRELLGSLDADLRIEPRRGGGTRITIALPLSQRWTHRGNQTAKTACA